MLTYHGWSLTRCRLCVAIYDGVVHEELHIKLVTLPWIVLEVEVDGSL